MNMKAGSSQLKPIVFIFILNFCFYANSELRGPQVCELCSGSVQNGSAVGRFCASSAGRTHGRCCFRNDNTSCHERIIGLDLSNCSLTRVEDLQGASEALMIDLSLNPIVNISDTVFQGFSELNYMILPQQMDCPGGNSSWEKVDVRDSNRYCEGQRDMCNQTAQLSIECPEKSLCAPYGPGFFECSCADNFHGYKCLREGEFPTLKVFGPLGASTIVLSLLLWVTQRRKVKSV